MTTTPPLYLPAHVPGGDGHRLWRLPVGGGRFVGPRDQVEALDAQLAVHAEQVAAVRVAEALDAADDRSYQEWLPLLRRRTVPKYVPARHVARYAKETTDA